jgi:glutamate synthase domain-containing protein 3
MQGGPESDRLRALVSEHAAETGSRRASDLLSDWSAALGQIWRVEPVEAAKVSAGSPIVEPSPTTEAAG